MSNKPDSNETTNYVPIEFRIVFYFFLILVLSALLSIPLSNAIKEWQDHKNTVEDIKQRLQCIEEQKDKK